ncbi:MAG TPA: GNAT family protein [Microvirga sp.]|jgi:RimJ/RimL family protein N-acetyltransferase|nr:GNAT family protein [Microvirga sp.]
MSDLAHWTPRPKPERRALDGRFVRLEPLDPARHGDDLFAASSGETAEDLWRWLADAPYPDRASFQPWLGRAAATDDPLFYAVIDRETGRAEGRLTFMRIDAANGVIETGNILFGPRLARTRGATEAIYLQARHAFEDLGYRRFEWKCNDRNEPSKRAALRFGFTYEGLFRQHMVVKGANRDTAWFAMLDHEWPSRRRAFERWLDPANFDAAGRQRLSLAALNATSAAADGIRLRPAGAGDLAAVAALQQAAYRPNAAILGVEPLPLREDYATILARYEVWLPEDAPGSGALILDPRPDHLLIWSVATAPEAQGQGLGNRLLAAADARARDLGLGTVRLYTGEKLAANIDWYRRRGYAVERIEALDDRRIVHMTKSI